MTTLDKIENRLADLEIENTYQRETIEALNETITKQWQEIDRLSQLMDQILDHLRQPGPDAAGTPADEPPPPHY